MQQVSELQLLPKNKFRELKGSKDNIKEYEIKTRNLRVYLFHEEHTGRIIVCGGKKHHRKKTLNILEILKNSIFRTLKTN